MGTCNKDRKARRQQEQAGEVWKNCWEAREAASEEAVLYREAIAELERKLWRCSQYSIELN